MKALLFTKPLPRERRTESGDVQSEHFRRIGSPLRAPRRRPHPVVDTHQDAEKPSARAARRPLRPRRRLSVVLVHPRVHGTPRLGAYLSLYRYMRVVRQQFPFDLIIASWAYPDGVAAARFARDADVPLVTNVLGSDINEQPKNPALRRRIQWGLGRANRVVAVSRAMRSRVVELGIPPERVVVQHNAVDGEAVLHSRQGRSQGSPWHRPPWTDDPLRGQSQTREGRPNPRGLGEPAGAQARTE